MKFIENPREPLPEVFEEMILRDILHYTTEDLKQLTIEKYVISLMYAKATYIKRDIVLALEKVFSGKKDKNRPTKGEYDFSINHPEVVEYIKANQIVDDPEIKWEEIK